MLKFVLDDTVSSIIDNLQLTHDFSTEVGGIIVGYFDKSVDAFRISDLTFPCADDCKGRFFFFRKQKGHQEIMDALWESSGRKKAYLGEWHTHDQETPMPSDIDIRTWIRISKNNNNFDQSFFIIVGRSNYKIWTIIDKKVVEAERI